MDILINVACIKDKYLKFNTCTVSPGGGGVLPYLALTRMCGSIGYGFQGFLS